MIRLSWVFALVLLVSSATDSIAAAPFSAREGLLVLRNGRVLNGLIILVGDEYRLSYPNGDEIRLPVSAVEFYCGSLREAYELKRFAIVPNNSRDHLDLADWCVTQGLCEQAAVHLKQAESSDPDEPRVAFIQRRITFANQPPSAANASRSTDKSQAGVIDSNELDEAIGRLPALGVETFTTHIQPLLVNRCSAGGCHGQNTKSEFRLIRTSSGQVMTRGFTHRNLISAYQQINFDNPQDSPLLKLPLGPHGNADRAIFGQANRKQHDLLVEWVNIVTKKPEVTVPERIGMRDAHLLQAVGIERPTFTRDVTGEETKQPFNADKTIENLGIDFSVKPAKFGNSLDKESRPDSSFTPADPFDPEIFNRRYSTETKKDDVEDPPQKPIAGHSLIPFRKNSPRTRASRN